jgi:molybdopterin molybdotransferase
MVEQEAASVEARGMETVDLLSADGRVLAESVIADRDIPPFPRSTRDGYAVRSADVSEIPARLRLIGEIKAGEKLENIPSVVNSGETVAIMTGAPLPMGANAVVMVEYSAVDSGLIELTRGATEGENIVLRGAEAIQGSVLIEKGTRLDTASIALAASAGGSLLLVYQSPEVAVLTTGDEIVEVDAAAGPTQIRNSNSYSLASQIRNAGGNPVLLPIAPDERHGLRTLIEQGLQSDLLLMTGGVSMGRYDLVEQVLSEMDAEFFFTGAKIQPGRPVVFGRCGVPAGNKQSSKYFFGLPGNPISTMVTFELFARPLIEALAGMSPRKLRFVYAKLKSEIRVKAGLKRFLPALISGEFEDSEVELVRWQGSGDIAATARANCYIVIPPDREQIPAGEYMPIMMR